MNISMSLFVFGFMVVLFSSAVQGLTGFGFALMAVPVLSLFFPFKTVLGIILFQGTFLTAFILFEVRKSVQLRKIFPMLVTGLIFTFIGGYLLDNINTLVLKGIVGIIIIICSTALYFNYKFKIKNEKLSYYIVGTLSGLLNGSTTLAGPPVILFLTNQREDKRIFRANLTAFFFIMAVYNIPNLILRDVYTSETLLFSAAFFPASVIGVIVGISAAHKIGEESFRKIAIFLVGITGVLAILQGFGLV